VPLRTSFTRSRGQERFAEGQVELQDTQLTGLDQHPLPLRRRGCSAWARTSGEALRRTHCRRSAPAPGRIQCVPPVASRPRWKGTSERHLPTVEELATQGDSGTLQLEEQVKKVKLMGLQTLSEHGERHHRRSPQIDVSADETISAPDMGALAKV